MRKRLAHTEPTPAELAAIDAEWPLIAAEIDVVDAEIALINAADRGGPTPMDWRRLRRAEAQVTKVAAELADRTRKINTRKPMATRVDAALPATAATWLAVVHPLIAAERRDRPAARTVRAA